MDLRSTPPHPMDKAILELQMIRLDDEFNRADPKPQMRLYLLKHKSLPFRWRVYAPDLEYAVAFLRSHLLIHANTFLKEQDVVTVKDMDIPQYPCVESV